MPKILQPIAELLDWNLMEPGLSGPKAVILAPHLDGSRGGMLNLMGPWPNCRLS